MGDAHEPREVDDTLAILKHLGRHAIALALVYPAASRARGNATSILAAVLEIVQTLVQVGRRVDARRIGED